MQIACTDTVFALVALAPTRDDASPDQTRLPACLQCKPTRMYMPLVTSFSVLLSSLVLVFRALLTGDGDMPVFTSLMSHSLLRDRFMLGSFDCHKTLAQSSC